MAKSTTPRTRRSEKPQPPAEIEVPEQSAAKQSSESAVAVEAPPAPPAPVTLPRAEAPAPPTPARTPDAPVTSEDVGSFDAETNARYEQVKGGKLFIKDLQVMDIHGLHDIARQEGIPDYIGLKK